MSSQTNTLTEGPLAKQIFLVSLPLALSNLLQVLFNMSDVAVVGRFAGSTALGAVGSTSTLVTLFTGFLIGLSNGINVLVARFYGARHPKDVEKTVHSAAIISAVAGVALLFIGLLGSPRHAAAAEHQGGSAARRDLVSAGVFSGYAGAGPVQLRQRGVQLHRRHQKAADVPVHCRCPEHCAEPVLCHRVRSERGGRGAGQRHQPVRFRVSDPAGADPVQDCYALDPHKLQLDPVQAKSILALGVPAGLQNAIFAIANLFIQAGVNSFDSLMVKGNSAAANADGLIYDCMAAFYMACASFMSQNYGAGRPDRVKKSYFISLGYSFGVGLVLGAALFFCGPAFLALFTTEAAVIDAGMKRVAVMAFAYGISAFMDCTIAASRGLGKTVVPTVIVVLGSCVFRVIWVYTIFAHFHTIPALYLLYPCSWILTALAEIAYFASCYKRAMAIFRKPAAA